MRIECDGCGIEIEKQDAVMHEVDDEVFYFCTEECFENTDFLEPSKEPETEPAQGEVPGGAAPAAE